MLIYGTKMETYAPDVQKYQIVNVQQAEKGPFWCTFTELKVADHAAGFHTQKTSLG